MLAQIMWIPKPDPSALRGVMILVFLYTAVAYAIYNMVKTNGRPSVGEQVFDLVISALWPIAFPLFIIVGVTLEYLDKRKQH